MFLLRTLGGLELLRTGDGGDHAIAMQAKRLALLAHLAALPPGTFRRRDTVLLLFWPDLDQEHARGALRQALHFLRKTLGEGAILTRGEDEIALEPSGFRSDARSLEAALAAGDPQQALTLYRGDFLEGVFVSDAAPELEDWISSERLRLRGLAARAAWMAAELPANRDSAGELVRRAVQWSGDDEAALRRGLRLLDGMGDRAGAAALYDEFARRVERDLDIQLSKETRELIRALRARRDSGSVDRAATLVEATAVQSATPAPASPITAHVRPGRRLLLAGVAGALVVLALAARIGPRRSVPPKVSANVVAIIPFHVSDIDTSLAWLQKDIVELLTIRLDGAGSPRLADPAAAILRWQREAGREATFTHEAALKIASDLGASRLIEGSIAGTREHLTLSARLSSVSGSEPLMRAVAQGPADSISQLIDRLAAQLLGMAAGMEGIQLASLTSGSLPAIRLFLAGQAEYRKGRVEDAVLRFDDALDLDSTFALAGLKLCLAAIWTSNEREPGRGCRIAATGRSRLTSADKALLDTRSVWINATWGFSVVDAAVRMHPERPEVWYALGDTHYHLGALVGEEQWRERASEAFRRGWLLDSAAGAGAAGEPPIAEPMVHFVELAHMRHDTAEVVRLVSSVLAVDSTSNLARVLMWHRAVMTSDSAREEFWANIASATQEATKEIVLFIAWTGLGTDDVERARAADEARLRAHNAGFSTFAFNVQALNGGRPREVAGMDPGADHAGNGLHRARLKFAMSWDGDTVAALQSAKVLARSTGAWAVGAAAQDQLYDTCTLGEWQGSRGAYQEVASAIRRLRQARPASTDSGRTERYLALCITLLEAMHASGTGAPFARAKVATADSLARELVDEICCETERISDANIQIARLWEREGDLSAAMRALSRRSAQFRIAPMYMSTFTREEGRIALLLGDTATAMSAYRHYLALRPNPQPSLQPGVDSIRATLALLEAR